METGQDHSQTCRRTAVAVRFRLTPGIPCQSPFPGDISARASKLSTAIQKLKNRRRLHCHHSVSRYSTSNKHFQSRITLNSLSRSRESLGKNPPPVRELSCRCKSSGFPTVSHFLFLLCPLFQPAAVITGSRRNRPRRLRPREEISRYWRSPPVRRCWCRQAEII